MRRIAWLLIIAIVLVPEIGRTQSNPGSFLISSPFSIVLTIGQWIIDRPEQPKVYYIRVRGHGATESDARNEAYKRAVQEAIGSLVVSESRVVNGAFDRREIIEYSSGYIDRFKILSQSHDGQQWIIDMDIWARHSAIADRVLNRAGSSRQFDGNRTEVQLQTLNHERSQGDRVLDAVLADYPERAYDLRVLTTESYMNYNRGLDVVVQVDLRLSDGYVYSLWEATKAISQVNFPGRCVPNCGGAFVLQMEGRRDRLLFADWAYTMVFDDRHRSTMISSQIIERQPMIQLTLKDGAGMPVHRTCYHYAHHHFVRMGDNWALIENNQSQRIRIEMRDLRGIGSVKSMDLAVVRQQSCPR